MFYTYSKKKEIEKRIADSHAVLKHEIHILSIRVDSLTKSLHTLLQKMPNSVTVTVNEHAPHGFKKDGTPRAKPGRKALKAREQ